MGMQVTGVDRTVGDMLYPDTSWLTVHLFVSMLTMQVFFLKFCQNVQKGGGVENIVLPLHFEKCVWGGAYPLLPVSYAQ